MIDLSCRLTSTTTIHVRGSALTTDQGPPIDISTHNLWRWAQPSTAAAPMLALNAATVVDSAAPSFERSPDRIMDTPSSFSLIFETVPRCEITSAMKLLGERDCTGHGGCVEPGDRAQPSDVTLRPYSPPIRPASGTPVTAPR